MWIDAVRKPLDGALKDFGLTLDDLSKYFNTAQDCDNDENNQNKRLGYARFIYKGFRYVTRKGRESREGAVFPIDKFADAMWELAKNKKIPIETMKRIDDRFKAETLPYAELKKGEKVISYTHLQLDEDRIINEYSERKDDWEKKLAIKELNDFFNSQDGNVLWRIYKYLSVHINLCSQRSNHMTGLTLLYSYACFSSEGKAAFKNKLYALTIDLSDIVERTDGNAIVQYADKKSQCEKIIKDFNALPDPNISIIDELNKQLHENYKEFDLHKLAVNIDSLATMDEDDWKILSYYYVVALFREKEKSILNFAIDLLSNPAMMSKEFESEEYRKTPEIWIEMIRNAL
ncbi:MAG: hypothetical protein LBU36_01130 [Clostridiales bacterium]|nr:hypothetical protein [Clostridiales bacterium]